MTDVLLYEQPVKFKNLIAKAWLQKKCQTTHTKTSKSLFLRKTESGDIKTGSHIIAAIASIAPVCDQSPG